MLLLVVAGINFIIDPYGLFRFIDIDGFNKIKPAAASQGPMGKAYQALRTQPGGLVLGNSRAEMGFDPEYAAWPADTKPVLNLALPGTGTATTENYLQHVIINTENNSASMPKMLILGIDLIDFLIDKERDDAIQKNPHKESRLLNNFDTQSKYKKWPIKFKDYFESTFTLSTLTDSIETILNQNNPYASNLTVQGFNPMQNYKKLAKNEGYNNLFKAKDQANIKILQRLPKNIFDNSGISSSRFKNLQQVLTLCRQHGISVNLVIYPYHARFLESIRFTGHWQDFENLKRAVTQMVEAESQYSSSSLIKLWDFSGFNQYSTEAVPLKGDRKSVTQWYWEAGHFKSELGNKILDRIFASTNTTEEWGVLLTPAMIENHLSTLRAQGDAYRQSHALEVAALAGLASQPPSKR
ncbi:hypothetical protein [Simplicispira psychrophila]|uniref:hypothetical protein n=1 Tax=Simplicispira psychrophila TaxID=80882 RepID=UPI0012EB4568|nr:hypothetical protein [Simplicispira psychrophila]